VHTIGAVVKTLWFLCVFWAVMNVLDEVRRSVAASEWSKRRPIARSLVPLAVRVGKVLVGIIAFISLLSELGYPVAGLIAGLGIGGIAFALAAQKTIENLFGAFSIGLDQPFREGDGVKVGEHIGTVEVIGLRSTRIRTGDRTVVTIPNAQVADSRIESFAERDRLKLALKLNLDYATTGKALRGVLDDVRTVLRDHPQIWDEQIDVRFIAFGPSALEVEVSAWFESNDMDKFRIAREQLLMTFLEIVEKHGTSLAFPSQSLYVKELPARASA
jgi:MscS family membrane protein